MTDRTWLRRDLSATLYLIANYFSIVNSTLQAKLHDTEGDPHDPKSPAHQLVKLRHKVYGKVMMLLPSMSQHSYWERWEPTVGGKYPKEAYDDIILRSTRIMGYLTLMAYTLTHPVSLQLDGSDEPGEEVDVATSTENPDILVPDQSNSDGIMTPSAPASTDDRAWLNALADVFDSLSPTHHTILSTLTLLSNSLLSGQSLPPFLPLPRPYEMTRRLMRLGHRTAGPSESDLDLLAFKLADPQTGKDDINAMRQDILKRSAGGGISFNTDDLLDPRNMEQPGYAEFAALQVCTTLVCDDLEALVKSMSGLVGVVDFSFRVEGSLTSSVVSDGSTLGDGKGKGKVD